MNTKLVALAAAIVTATAFAPAADAAGGVRLGFGGPLGTFTATPSKGAASRAHTERKMQTARKRRPEPAVREAARKPEAQLPRSPRAERARKEGKATDASRIEIAKVHDARETFAPLTGSSALIQSAVPEPETEATTGETATEATADAPAGNATAEAEDTAQDGAQGSATCAKFIPAVGTTVTIGCDD